MSKGFPAKVWREAKKISSFLGQRGRLLYFTEIKVAGEGIENVPYIVGLVKVNNHLVSGRIVDWEGRSLRKGKKVEAVVRRLRVEKNGGLVKYGICWRIVADE